VRYCDIKDITILKWVIECFTKSDSVTILKWPLSNTMEIIVNKHVIYSFRYDSDFSQGVLSFLESKYDIDIDEQIDQSIIAYIIKKKMGV